MKKLFEMSKKGQDMSWLTGAAISLVVLIVVVGFGASLIGDLSGDNTSVAEGQVYEEGQDANLKFSGKFGLIVTIVVLVFIIGLLGMLFLKGGHANG